MGERAGKDLLLKYGQTLQVDIAIGTAATPTNLLATAHGKSVGDIVIFDTVPGSVTEVTANTPYYIISKGADDFKISATAAGTAITFTDNVTDLDITVYSSIGGLRSHKLAFASSAIDGTNYGSGEWKKNIDGAGIRSMSVSGDGVITDDDNYKALRAQVLANSNVNLAFIDVVESEIFMGEYKVTSLELGAAHDAEGTYSLSAESSGAVALHEVA